MPAKVSKASRFKQGMTTMVGMYQGGQNDVPEGQESQKLINIITPAKQN